MTKLRGGSDVASWLVSKTSGFLDSRFSRRSFIARTTLVGTAVAASGCAVITRPGAPYTFISDCPSGSLCRDGYTEFCCVINQGVNACPPNTAAAGWWRADYSVYCNGTRYYIDCNNWSGAGPCRCAAGCGTRKAYCNHFRYGQCNQHIPGTGVIACRMVVCVPPYHLNLGCQPSGAVDNSTANHNADCAAYVPPPAVEVSLGAAVSPAAGVVQVLVRQGDGQMAGRRFDGAVWAPWEVLGGDITSRVVATGSPGPLAAFARGAEHEVWVKEHTGAWGSWTSLGGQVTSDPAVTWDGAGNVWVFVRGAEHGLWAKRYAAGSWGEWESLGGVVASVRGAK